MGYRSDVTAVFYTTDKEKFPTLKLFIDENFPEELAGNLKPLDSDTYFGYSFDDPDVKWYESYSEVIGFNTFVDKFNKLAENTHWGYELVRIGEEENDIELDGNEHCDNVLSVSRIVNFNL